MGNLPKANHFPGQHSRLESKPRLSPPPEGAEGEVSQAYLRQLERDLRAAGVFFRFPSPPPPFEDEPAKGEVNVALATLDASLDGFSCSSSDSSGESAPLPASHGAPWTGSRAHQSAVESGRENRTVAVPECSRITSSSVPSTASSDRALSTRKNLRSSKEMLDLRPEREALPSAGNKTVILVRGNEGMSEDAKEGKSGTMERLNLIEEVFVSSKTRVVPESTVQMKAYYPSVDFCQRTSPQPVQIVIDSDSGHESGATSPCGTLTGEETSSPPPSPSIQKQNPTELATDKPLPPAEQPLKNGSFTKETPSENCEDLGQINQGQLPVSESVGTAVISEVPTEERNVGIPLEESSSPHFVVVAIDFGTTYSGYAFSFTRDPDNIHMMKKWEGK